MNAGKESEIRRSVHGALTKLATGNVYTLTDLFGKLSDRSSDYGRAATILKRLVSGGLINASEREGPGVPRIYQGKNLAELGRIASDEFELSRLIWPGRTPPKPVSAPVSEPLLRALKSLEEIEPAPVNTSMYETKSAPTDPEILPSILKLLGAVIENVIYIREKVDGLDSVACSHCTCPEEHRATGGE